MKTIYVLRHATKELETEDITKLGKEKTLQLHTKLPKFDLCLSSDNPYSIETAFLLSGFQPLIDKNASFLNLSKEDWQKINVDFLTNPDKLAGMLFDQVELHNFLKDAGSHLVRLIKETFLNLPERGKALIVSHNEVMIAAYKIMNKEPFEKKVGKGYSTLKGFIVKEKTEIIEF